MPQRKSAIKKLRQDKKRRLRNLKRKTKLKKSIKRFQAFLREKKLEEAKQALKEVISLLDKAAAKKLIDKKTAARKKSRFSTKLSLPTRQVLTLT